MRTSRVFTARRPGSCAGCGTEIEGRQCRYHGRRLYHAGCVPSHDRRADSEYYQGIRDVENWHENRRLFGDDAADRMELERELREGWDY